MNARPMPSLARAAARLDGYDPQNLPVDVARQAIALALGGAVATEHIATAQALDRVLAGDLLSPIDVPAHDNAAMDGFAFAGGAASPDDRRLLLVGRALAGQPFCGAVAPGQAVRVTTGAVLPPGVDTVVMQEHCRVEGDRVCLPATVVPGSHCRRRGEDLRAGAAALPAGRCLSAADIGLIASLGLASVDVRRRLRVALLSTGDELRTPGEPLAPGQIYDSNRFALSAMLARLGADVIDLGVIPDRRDALETALADACVRADVVLSSGGMSVGEADFTRSVTGALGEVLFWRLAMRPGRPLAFGRLGEALYFGLPGNPVAALVSFCVFVRPALLARMGLGTPRPDTLRVRAAHPISKKPGRTEYPRATLQAAPDGRWEAALTGDQGSGVLRSMSQAHCLLILGPGQADVAAGDLLEAMPLAGIV